MSTMTPKKIVEELDRYIIGQPEAKRAVAIALRNRWRRMETEPELRDEILPKNILMIGPTGVGKTEIARRLAKLSDAPFIKVEATKFTEVGFVGRDVESIIRDLADVAVKQARIFAMKKVEHLAREVAEDRILNAILPKSDELEEEEIDSTRKVYLKKLRSGKMDDKQVEIDISSVPMGIEIMAPPGMEEMTSQLQNLFQNIGGERTKKRKLRVKDARRMLQEEEASKLINEDELKTQALVSVEQNGIVFIDEIDKVSKRSEHQGGDISREGVQRDLLPLVEGSTVSTKYGMVKTDHILFIASGAFHVAKPSDLIPELQGRFPIRVELSALNPNDFERILTEPDASLTKQYSALMNTEGVTLQFTKKGIKRIAEASFHVNDTTENIGARRLQTVMERIVEEISFSANERSGEKIVIDDKYVKDRLSDLIRDQDLSRYIL